MRTEDFDYHLPARLIAQRPVARRSDSRLMVVRRSKDTVEHARFADLPSFLRAGDVLVLNDTRVMKCRLYGEREGNGGKVELLLVGEGEGGHWEALVRPGKRAKPGVRLVLEGGLGRAEILGISERGRRTVRIESEFSPKELMARVGHVPLPPYIRRADDPQDEERYQTVYASREGAVAAPTAGLHFTGELLERLRGSGVTLACLTLHVGPGTFKPVRTNDPAKHELEPEWYSVAEDQAALVNEARAAGGRVVAVGTTVARVLETVAVRESVGRWVARAGEGWTDKYILPPYEFRMVDCLLTNFHLPRTTLLMLVAALAGRELILNAYREAVAREYRFYSYGDAMLVL